VVLIKLTGFFTIHVSDFAFTLIYTMMAKKLQPWPSHTGNISATMVLTFTDGPRNGKPSIEHGEGDSFDPKW